MREGATAAAAVHDAFTQRRFKKDWSTLGRYSGTLDPTDTKVDVAVTVEDLDFVRAPVVRLVGERPPHLPHVLASDGTLCYLDMTTIVLDRYDPGGTILQCLDRAERVIRDAIKGRLDSEVADEFADYWSSTTVYADLPPEFAGRGFVQSLRGPTGSLNVLVRRTGDSWLCKAYPTCEASSPCLVLNTSSVLDIATPTDWPPRHLAAFNCWLHQTDPTLSGKLEEAFVEGEGYSQWIALKAPNATVLACFHLPRAYQKSEFTENRRAKLGRLLSRIGAQVKMDRFVASRADEGYVFQRNMFSSETLASKAILIVGCGTIGSFLAHQVAQSGAGSDGGSLTLVDPDVLKPANLGRHLLGAPYLARNKAEGCREFLQQQLPMLDVRAVDRSVLKWLHDAHRFDLVVDATGEEAVSLALNDRAIHGRPHYPPVLHTWLTGNGAAAQCLLADGEGHACLKCLKPELAGPLRFRTLRTGVEIVHERGHACEDARYVPFPVTRSVAAAALTCEAMLDWVNGRPSPRFRSRTLDRVKAQEVKDANPAPIAACPACSKPR